MKGAVAYTSWFEGVGADVGPRVSGLEEMVKDVRGWGSSFRRSGERNRNKDRLFMGACTFHSYHPANVNGVFVFLCKFWPLHEDDVCGERRIIGEERWVEDKAQDVEKNKFSNASREEEELMVERHQNGRPARSAPAMPNLRSLAESESVDTRQMLSM